MGFVGIFKMMMGTIWVQKLIYKVLREIYKGSSEKSNFKEGETL